MRRIKREPGAGQDVEEVKHDASFYKWPVKDEGSWSP
jgi:hypothetical protein